MSRSRAFKERSESTESLPTVDAPGVGLARANLFAFLSLVVDDIFSREEEEANFRYEKV
jgi:hypothetical protein